MRFPGQEGEVLGALARPRMRPQAPGLVVVHENRGLVEHVKDVARRLAKVGYVALAGDLASHEGGTERFSDSAQVTAVLGRTPVHHPRGMLLATVAYLRTQPLVRADRLGAVGWCFGGGMVWRLVTRSPELRAAVAFYGPNPPLGGPPRIRAAVLGVYGELDERINQGIPARCLAGENPLRKADRGPQKSLRDFWGGLDWLRRYLEG